MPFGSLPLTGEQIRAARALARIEQAALARRTGLSLETIKRLERIRGPVDANVRTLSAITLAFQELGVVFDGCGDGGVGIYPAGSAPPGAPGPGRAAPPPRAPREADDKRRSLFRLIYHSASRAPGGADLRAALDAIDRVAAERNTELGVTGALVAGNGRFLQVLEGPKEAVQLAFGAICVDPRHGDLRILDGRAVGAQRFGGWKLCCGLFSSDRTVLGREPAMADGLHPDLLSPASALGLVVTMCDLEGEAPRNGRGPFRACALTSACLDRMCAEGGRETP